MKVLYLTNYFDIPFWGGTIGVVYNLSKELIKKGHKVSILCSNYKKNGTYSLCSQSPTSMEGIDVHRLGTVRLGTAYEAPFSFIHALRNNPDIAHINPYNLINADISGLVLKHLKNKPLFLTAGGAIFTRSWSRNLPGRIYDTLLGKKMLKLCDGVIAYTDAEKEDLVRVFDLDRDKVHVMSNAVGDMFLNLQNTPSKLDIEKKYNISPQEKLVLLVARMDKVKGIEYLVKAAKIVSENRKDIKFLIIGDNPKYPDYKNYIQQLVKDLRVEDTVTLAGFVNNDELIAAYKRADVFVMSSVYEGCPTALLEAMACGKPAVATEVGGIPQVINSSKAGTMVPPRNPQALAEALVELLDNPTEMKKMSSRGKEYVNKNCTWDTISEKHLKLYNAFLD